MISKFDWKGMTSQERDAMTFSLLDITPEQIEQLVQEFKQDVGKAPNCIFISADSLIRLPGRIKHFITKSKTKLVVIPMDAEPGKFIVSLQDPYQWGNLFFS